MDGKIDSLRANRDSHHPLGFVSAKNKDLESRHLAQQSRRCLGHLLPSSVCLPQVLVLLLIPVCTLRGRRWWLKQLGLYRPMREIRICL